MPRLAVTDVSIRVAGRRLLDGVSLEVAEGERVGLAAPSGAGKTELLRAIAWLRDVDAGRFTLGGAARETIAPPRWRRRVTYVSQAAVMLPGTVEENLHRPFRYAAVGGAPDDHALSALLARLGLHRGARTADARTLSAGERQRISLVRAFAIAPDVLLLDEPTSALDASATREVESLLREEASARGLGVLFVSHDAAQLERFADRVVDLRAHMPSDGADA